jgi:lipopolysaccharide export system permease protein
MRIGNPDPVPEKGDALSSLTQAEPRTISTRLLVHESAPHLRAELGSRLGMTLASINLLLIALASAHTNPRTGRSGSLLFAMLSFAAYYNMINVGQGWVASSKLSLSAMLLLLHGSVFVAAALWLLKQDRQWSWRTLLPGSRSQRTADKEQ